MWKTVAIYGISFALLVAVLKILEFHFFVQDFTIEFYVSLVAVLFTTLGIWVGLKLTRKKVIISDPNFKIDESILTRLGISAREYEVLELMAKGLSNQEIADSLFVSHNTVKTHSSNLFMKLNAKRRTQAIQKAKEYRILP